MVQPDPAQVYSPAEDTFLLLEAARQEIQPGDRVLEIGTGSGFVAEALGKAVQCMIATDISPYATAAAYGKGVMVIRTDLSDGVRGQFDLILFNPPYLPTRKEERICDWLEYALDGGANGRDVIERFLKGIGRVLAPGGRILLLISSLTGLHEVISLAERHGFSTTVVRTQIVEDEKLYVLRSMCKNDRIQSGSPPRP